MSAYCERYSVKGSSGVSAGIFRKLIFKSVFFLGNFFFGLKAMLKPCTNRGSVQKVSIICLFWKVMARNCLLDEICRVCVLVLRSFCWLEPLLYLPLLEGFFCLCFLYIMPLEFLSLRL